MPGAGLPEARAPGACHSFPRSPVSLQGLALPSHDFRGEAGKRRDVRLVPLQRVGRLRASTGRGLGVCVCLMFWRFLRLHGTGGQNRAGGALPGSRWQQPQGSGVEDRAAVGSGQGQGAGAVWALPGEESISPVCICTQAPPVWACREPVMVITARWADRGRQGPTSRSWSCRLRL